MGKKVISLFIIEEEVGKHVLFNCYGPHHIFKETLSVKLQLDSVSWFLAACRFNLFHITIWFNWVVSSNHCHTTITKMMFSNLLHSNLRPDLNPSTCYSQHTFQCTSTYRKKSFPLIQLYFWEGKSAQENRRPTNCTNSMPINPSCRQFPSSLRLGTIEHCTPILQASGYSRV